MKGLTELQWLQAIQDYLSECDSDELARLTGELFGGECQARFCDSTINDNIYEFEPNEYYSGQFDNVSDIN